MNYGFKIHMATLLKLTIGGHLLCMVRAEAFRVQLCDMVQSCEGEGKHRIPSNVT
jgi:hypothetical protein